MYWFDSIWNAEFPGTFPLWFHIAWFGWSPQSTSYRWEESLASVRADLQLPPVPSDGLIYHQNPHEHHSPQVFMTRRLRLYGQEGSKRGGRYSIKNDWTVLKLYFYSDDSNSFTQDILPFLCQKLHLCAWKGAGMEAFGRSDPGALQGWLKNKLISGPIDGGQAGKYHGKLNYRDSWERRHWPALINSM